jgi:hypothetical protein
MPEKNPNIIDDTADRRVIRVELVARLRALSKHHEETAKTYADMFKYSWVTPSVIIFANETIQPLQGPGSYIIDGASVLMGIGIAASARKLKIHHEDEAVTTAEKALGYSQEEPAIPIANWIKTKLDIEE